MEKNLEELTGRLYEIKNIKEAIGKQLKEISEQEDYLEGLIIAALQVEGLQKATTTWCTVSLKQSVFPGIENWSVLWEYMVKNNVPLLNKAVNSAAWREMIEQGIEVPGVSSYDKITLLFRKK